MKENEFVRQNNQKWSELETSIESGERNPKKISRLFIQITDDLSYARTFYPSRSVREYINGLARILNNDLAHKEKFSFKRIIDFFVTVLPSAMYASRKNMRVSLLVFVACMLLGMFTSMTDKGFAQEILGWHYVEITEANIKEGKPMAIYESRTEVKTFLPIFLNNLIVALRTFFLGVIGCIGALFILIYNGVMVGVFQFFFIERGLFWESFLSIWTHGALEISAIIIAGGAGITLGAGLLFPGTYTRLESFKMAARKGMIIMLGISPIILIAAFIEGFLTRHTEIPDAYRFSFIMICFFFVLLYFVIYPRVLAKRNDKAAKMFEFEPRPVPEDPFNKVQILSIGKLYNHSIGLFLRNIGFVFGRALLVIILLITVFIYGPNGVFTYYKGGFSDFFRFDDLFNFSGYPAVFLLTNGCITLFLTMLAVRFYKSILHQKSSLKIYIFAALGAFVISVACTYLLSLDSLFGVISAILVLPFLSIIFFNGLLENSHILHGAKRTMLYMSKSWGKYFVAFLLVGLTACGFIYLMNFVIFRLLQDFLAMILTNEGADLAILYYALTALTEIGLLFTFSALVFSCAAIMHFTGKETSTANHLFKQLSILKVN